MNKSKIQDNKLLYKSFGIGSFLFSVDLDESKSLESVMLDLSKSLKNIPGLSNLEIKPAFDAPRVLPKGKHVLNFLNINFDNDVSTDLDFGYGVGFFRVITKVFYDVPITLVFSRNEASGGVFVVREFLRKYLKESFKLDVIGPSPFHVDFFVEKAKDFSLVVTKEQAVYDKITVYTKTTNTFEIAKSIFKEVGYELNLFYLIYRFEIEKSDEWAILYSKLQKIQSPKNKNLFEKMWYKLFLNKYLTDTTESLISFEINLLDKLQIIEERYRDTYNSDKKFIISYVDRARICARKYPVKSIKELLSFQTSKLFNANQNLTALVAALIGGMIGGIMTILLT